MNLHEYQPKQLFAQYGIPVPKGRVAGSAIAKRLNGKSTVRVKMTSPERSKPTPKRVPKVVRKAVKKMPSRTARKAAPRRPK
jgi:succinyl-CoA synthetase beta subunit